MQSKGAGLLTGSKLPSKVVEVPEWGASVVLRGFTALQRAEFIARGSDLKGNRPAQLREIQPWVVIQSACDPDTGERLFTEADAPALLEQDGRILDRLSGEVMELSGLGSGSREEAGKDSAPTATGASSSGSPSPSEDGPSPSSSRLSGPASSSSGRSSPSSSPSALAARSIEPARSSPPS